MKEFIKQSASLSTTFIPNIFGNRCGHDKSRPRSYLRPAHHGKRPSIIEQAQNSAQLYFWNPIKYLRNLSLNEMGYKTRSERREAIVCVLGMMLHYVDLDTLKVGVLTGNEDLISPDLEYIAKHAGIGAVRAKRAIWDLVKAGYLEVTRKTEEVSEGVFRSYASIRCFTIKLFYHLGIKADKMAFAQAWRRKKKEREAKKQVLKTLFKPKPIVAPVKKLASGRGIYQKDSGGRYVHLLQMVPDFVRENPQHASKGLREVYDILYELHMKHKE